MIEHQATKDLIESIPATDLKWSLICVAMMKPAGEEPGEIGLLDAPHQHNLLLQATFPPGWRDSWLRQIPVIGGFLNVWYLVFWQYETTYEDVAGFLAEDLEKDGDEWVGMKVGMRSQEKKAV